MDVAVRILAAFVVLLAAAPSASADDGLSKQVAAHETSIADWKAKEAAAESAVTDLKTKLQTLEQQKLRAARSQETAAKAIEELTKQKPAKEAAATQAQQAVTGAANKLAGAEAAQAALKDKPGVTDEQKQQAEAQVAEAKKQLEAAQQARQGPADELLKLLEAVAANSQAVEQAKGAEKQAADEIAATSKALQEQQAALAEASKQRLNAEQALRTVLVSAGRWVSFTDEVAPILQDRCIACHNARTAKGRLNLESYAAFAQGGESGPAFVGGDPDESPVCYLVADGSMPQDAEPLTAEQIATIQKWVEFGGRLDPGVEAAARLIQVMPRRPQPKPPEHYPSALPVTAVAWSPDGTIVATSGYHEVLLWNAADGTLLRRLGNVAESVYGLSFHPDGQRIAVAAGTPGETGELKVFRTTDGELLADLVRADDVVLGVAFSPDGASLACSGADRSIRVFDVSTGALRTTIEDHADWVLAIAWSPDGSKLASASRDKTSKVFDAGTGDAQGTFNGHGDIVYDVAFTPDGKQVATCGADKLIRLWKVEDSKEVRKLDGGKGEILQLAMLPDGRAATCGADKLARVHQTADGKLLQTFAEHPDWIYAIDAHAGSNLAATGCADGRVRIWKLDTGESVREWSAAP